MPISEAERADLYNGLAEVLGQNRAEILMTHWPRYDINEVATKSDLADLRAELRDGLAAVNDRLDRLFLTILVGMFGIVTAMVGVVLTIR